MTTRAAVMWTDEGTQSDDLLKTIGSSAVMLEKKDFSSPTD